MSNYLEQILDATKAHNRGVATRRDSLNRMVSMLQPPPPAPVAAAPVVTPGASKNPHSMNDGHGHSSGAEVKGLNAEFNAALTRMIKDSGGKIKINSGYRSSARQAKIYADAVRKYGSEKAARKWAAPPGKSNHNHGLAADLGFSGDGEAWAHANAGKYGLVFPMGHEPWHIEPVNARSKRRK